MSTSQQPTYRTLASLTNEQLGKLLEIRGLNAPCLAAIRGDKYSGHDVFGTGTGPASVDRFVDEMMDDETRRSYSIKAPHITSLRTLLRELRAAEDMGPPAPRRRTAGTASTPAAADAGEQPTTTINALAAEMMKLSQSMQRLEASVNARLEALEAQQANKSTPQPASPSTAMTSTTTTTVDLLAPPPPRPVFMVSSAAPAAAAAAAASNNNGDDDDDQNNNNSNTNNRETPAPPTPNKKKTKTTVVVTKKRAASASAASAHHVDPSQSQQQPQQSTMMTTTSTTNALEKQERQSRGHIKNDEQSEFAQLGGERQRTETVMKQQQLKAQQAVQQPRQGIISKEASDRKSILDAENADRGRIRTQRTTARKHIDEGVLIAEHSVKNLALVISKLFEDEKKLRRFFVDVEKREREKISVQFLGAPCFRNWPLYTAVDAQDLRMTQCWLQAGADPNMKVNILLPKELRWDPKTDDGAESVPLLYFACTLQGAAMADIVKALIQSGADKNVMCASAAVEGHQLSVLRVLLDDGGFDMTDALTCSMLRGFEAECAMILEHLAKTQRIEDIVEHRVAFLFFHEHGAAMLRIFFKHGLVASGYLLHRASFHGNADCVTLLLEAGAEVDTAGQSPYVIAAKRGHAHVIDLLCSHFHDSDVVNNLAEDGKNPLHIACERGDTECVKTLLRCPRLDRSATTTTLEHSTAVYVAARNNKPAVLELLLADGGFDIDAMLSDTAFLSTRSTDVHQDFQYGPNPLLVSCYCGNVECVALLLRAGCDRSVRNYRLEQTALHVVVQLPYDKNMVSSVESQLTILQMLIDDGGFDFNAVDACAATTLSVAFSLQDFSPAAWLLKTGYHGKAPLAAAATSGQPLRAVKFVLDFGGFDIDERDACGRTALLALCERLKHYRTEEAVDVATLLLEHGADLHARTPENANAVFLAARNGGSAPLLPFLIDRGCSRITDPVTEDSTGDWCNPFSCGDVALHAAAMSSLGDCCRVLLDAGAPVDYGADGSTDAAYSALWLAAFRGNEKSCALLLSRGADPNSKNNRSDFNPDLLRICDEDDSIPVGSTCLRAALLASHLFTTVACVRVLLADPRTDCSIAAADGKTPLQAAQEKAEKNAKFNDVVALLQ